MTSTQLLFFFKTLLGSKKKVIFLWNKSIALSTFRFLNNEINWATAHSSGLFPFISITLICYYIIVTVYFLLRAFLCYRAEYRQSDEQHWIELELNCKHRAIVRIKFFVCSPLTIHYFCLFIVFIFGNWSHFPKLSLFSLFENIQRLQR